MKKILPLLAALAAFALPALSHAEVISGDISGGGLFNGTVTRAGAWIEENPVDGQEVNFWTFSGNAGDTVSFTVSSDVLEFGMSLYQGVLEEFDLIVPGFENSGSFASLFFVAGTPDFGATGTELLNVVLPTTGAYLLAIGGEGFGFGESYGYSLDANVAPVPVPAAVWLFGSTLLGLAGFRRRRAA